MVETSSSEKYMSPVDPTKRFLQLKSPHAKAMAENILARDAGAEEYTGGDENMMWEDVERLEKQYADEQS